ncbi:hypothetical protein MBLNU459_g1165t1 [Dothideomycetes sp. NU459]
MADTDSPPDVWTEEQYEASLAHLEALQDQLMALRTTIPSLYGPLIRPNTTKSEAFGVLKKAAVAAVADVKDFRSQWQSQQTQQILARAKESDARDHDLSAGQDIPIYGWTDGYSGVRSVVVKEEQDQVADSVASSPERPLKEEMKIRTGQIVPPAGPLPEQPAGDSQTAPAKKPLFKRPDWAQDPSSESRAVDIFAKPENG